MHFRKPNMNLDNGLQELDVDEDFISIRPFLHGHTIIDVYVEILNLNMLSQMSPEHRRSQKKGC